MKRLIRTLTLSLSMILVFCLSVNGEITREEGYYSEKIEKSFNVSEGGTLKIDSDVGTISVLPSKSNELRVLVIKKCKCSSEKCAKDKFENIDVVISKENNNVFVKTRHMHSGNSNNAWTSIEVEVPKNYNADLTSETGSIDVGDLVGNLKVDVSTGSLKLGNIEGDVKVNTSTGSIRIDNVKGLVDAETSTGSIKAGNVTRDVRLSTSTGSISIQEVKGKAVLDAGTGSISIGPSTGDVKADTGTGSIKISETKGGVAADTGTGSILVEGSAAPVNVSTGTGSIKIQKAKNPITATTGTGSIKAEVLILKKGEDIILKSGTGSITLYLPENAAADFELEIELDRPKKEVDITSDFDLKIQKTEDWIRGTGTVNGGGSKIKLKTCNSDIKLYKLK